MFGLAAVAALIALHELYWMTRTLRPVVLAGYLGALAALLGATLGGADWALAGLMSTLLFAFVIKGGVSTVSVSVTVLGRRLDRPRPRACAVAPGHRRSTGCSRCTRCCSRSGPATPRRTSSGRSSAGRHKLAPTVSPGKTWEGLIAGNGRHHRGDVHRALRGELPLDPGVARARRGDRDRRSARRPVRVGAEARRRREGLGPFAPGATAVSSIGSTRFSSPGSPPTTSSWPSACLSGGRRSSPDSDAWVTRGKARAKRPPYTLSVKRIAVLGATGSIGRQALEIIDANPELEACALASGHERSGDRGHEARDRARPGRRRPHRAARPGRARRRPQRRRRLRRPAGDALGARARRHPRAGQQGEPRRRRRARTRARERGGGLLLPVDSEHSALFQCLEGGPPRPSTRSS